MQIILLVINSQARYDKYDLSRYVEYLFKWYFVITNFNGYGGDSVK